VVFLNGLWHIEEFKIESGISKTGDRAGYSVAEVALQWSQELTQLSVRG
jgi:hypothetical protein